MTGETLPWPEAFGRMQAAGFNTATGKIRWQLPNESVPHGELRFWHQAPDSWRVEDENGAWHVQDGRRQLVRTEGRMEDMSMAAITFSTNHPRTLFGVRQSTGVTFDWLRQFPTPNGPGKPVEVAGRRAWEFAFLSVKPDRKPFPLRVTVDGATGTVLRQAMPEADYLVEVVEFTPDVQLPEDIFTWDGPVSTRHNDERAEHERTNRWLNDTDLAMPHWWPRGLGYHAGDGDPATGAYRIMLEVPGYPELSRWPAGTPMPARWDGRHQQRHVHRWRDHHWEWALAVDEPLTDEDLTRVIDSIA